MKTGLTRIVMLIDRSGSMQTVRESTVTGINGFIDSQKKESGEASIKLVQFDNNMGIFCYDTILDKPINDITEITYEQFSPRGSTPL